MAALLSGFRERLKNITFINFSAQCHGLTQNVVDRTKRHGTCRIDEEYFHLCPLFRDECRMTDFSPFRNADVWPTRLFVHP